MSGDWVSIPSENDYAMCFKELVDEDEDGKCDLNLLHAIAEEECHHHWSTKGKEEILCRIVQGNGDNHDFVFIKKEELLR